MQGTLVTWCMQHTQQHCRQPDEFNLNRGQDAGHDHDPTCQTADGRQNALQANLARTILHMSHVYSGCQHATEATAWHVTNDAHAASCAWHGDHLIT